MLAFLAPPFPAPRWGTGDLPGSWAALASVPCSQTPVEPERRGPRIDSAVRSGFAFRVQKRVGLHHVNDFGAQSHGPAAHCLRFTSTLASVRARLASGWRPLPCPVGTLTRRLLPRVSGRYSLLSGQSWLGAPRGSSPTRPCCPLAPTLNLPCEVPACVCSRSRNCTEGRIHREAQTARCSQVAPCRTRAESSPRPERSRLPSVVQGAAAGARHGYRGVRVHPYQSRALRVSARGERSHGEAK
jgi:hypothetical protein